MSTALPAVALITHEKAAAAFDRAVAAPKLSGSDYVRGWINRIRFHAIGPDGRVQLAVPDKFYRDFIDDHFRADLMLCMEAELRAPVELEWVIDGNLKEQVPVASAPPVAYAPPPVANRSLESRRLDERFTFDTFVTAPSNQLAWAGAGAISDHPDTAFNPLFIYGGTGLGKTHLLHAIGNSLLSRNPDLRIMYLSSEEFTNDFILAVRDQRMPEFRRKYREECDCLLIDDIQFLGTKEMTQEEFFHTFNTLQAARKPVAITSDTIPSEIPGLAERLRTRFSSGLIADIQEPDYETRVAILKKKAESLGIELPDPVANYIARTVQHNVRELQMALNRVYAHHSLTGQPLTVDLAAHILKNVLPPSRPLDLEEVQKEAAKYYRLGLEELRGPKRQRKIVRARQAAMYLARKLTNASFPEIGHAFKRDHSTVMSSCEKIERDLATDEQLKKEIDELSTRLAR